jgi:DeoR/GlpR family transcriptional regulator of sugar metabolism
MLGQAKRSYLLLDSSKFDVLRHELVCPLGEIDEIVTDSRPDGALRAELTKAAVDVTVAAP